MTAIDGIRPTLSLIALAMLQAAAVAGDAGDWPQFRGPTGQGLAPDARPPMQWGDKRNVVWKTDLPGLGHSSPVMAGDQVWVTTAAPDGRELGAIGLDRSTGKLLHKVVVFQPAQAEKIHEKNTYASTTPVLHQGRLYVHFGTFGAACIDTAAGQVTWKNENLRIEHQGGPGSSPVLCGDLLIVTCDGADRQFTAALELDTGRIRWKRDRSAPFRDDPITHRAFSTPLLIEHDGRQQLLSPGADQLHSYDPATGEELWHVRYTGFSTVPRPAFANGVAFFCTGYFAPELWAVKVDGRGDVSGSHIAWKSRAAVPEIPSPLVWEERVFTVSDKGVATALDAATGKRLWSLRLGGNHSASPLLAGKHLLFCSEDGLTRFIDPSAEKPKVLATNRLPGRILASPAAIGTSLYLRTDKALYRIEESADGRDDG